MVYLDSTDELWHFGKKMPPGSSSDMRTTQHAMQQNFLEMYDSYSNELFRFCLSKTRNRDDSLDIAQETFIKTWDYLRKGNKIDNARAFLYRTARNLIIDRGRKKQALSLDALAADESHHDIPDTTLAPDADKHDRTLMLEKLKQLPEHHYEILVLRYIQELTIPEIATIYKESENTVSVRIHRAIKVAQKIFPEELYEQ